MKSEFVYLINGKEIGTWANSKEEAERNLREQLGNIPMEFIRSIYKGKSRLCW